MGHESLFWINSPHMSQRGNRHPSAIGIGDGAGFCCVRSRGGGGRFWRAQFRALWIGFLDRLLRVHGIPRDIYGVFGEGQRH